MRASLKRRGVNQAVDGAVLDLVARRLRSATTAAEIIADDGSDAVADTVAGVEPYWQISYGLQSDFSARELDAATLCE